MRILKNILTLASFCLTVLAGDRITESIDNAKVTAIPNQVRRLRSSTVDEGPVNPAQQMHLTLFLKPSATQKTALDQLLIDVQDPASPRYHDWLTPEQYADRFAISAADAARITKWLEAQGFQIGWVGRGRSLIVFHGTADAVEAAFHPAVHILRSTDAVHYANTQNPSVPRALQDVVQAIGGLHDFRPRPVRRATPAFTGAGGGHSLAPDDLATIYDFASMLSSGIDGTGQKVAVSGQSTILMSDMQAYNTKFNLAAPNIQVIAVPGLPGPAPDPGFNNQDEADLDLQIVNAVARNASIYYVYSEDADQAVYYAIDQNFAPVINHSYGGCDTEVEIADLLSAQSMAQQGNAQGITWVSGTGDSGAAGCDPIEGPLPATMGLSTGFPPNVPEVTGVGGTQFNEGAGTYWSSANDSHGGSALSYIPEAVWNQTSTANGLLASTGGPSTWFFKPSWQTGPGVPNDGMRDTPDISFSASSHDYYYTFSQGSVVAESGTSSAGPVFSGMLALLSQYLVTKGAQTKPGVGNVNPMLYRLAQSNPAAFHDVTSGNNIVPCLAGTSGCVNGEMGYTAGPGYDMCTGLGSIDFAVFANAAIPVPSPTSLVVVSSNQNPVYQKVSASGVSTWSVTLTLTNDGGLSTTLTGFSVDGTSEALSTYFPTTAISAYGSVKSAISFHDAIVPRTHTFAFTGSDANGRSWTASVSLQFVGVAPSNGPTPAITGTTNGASFQQAYAPGMILSIFGSNLGAGTGTATGVPLSTNMQSFEATVNNVLAPIYYVSPTQANVQIPYGTPPGTATLTVYQGGQSANTQLQISAAAPGIFADANGNTVPYTSGAAGQALLLFITGDGEVSPALATGAAPASTIPVANLPKSVLPVSMTIGGQPAQILFAGIPYGLVGVTQINFVVPAGLSTGPQPVVVTIGTTPSKPATFTVTPGS